MAQSMLKSNRTVASLGAIFCSTFKENLGGDQGAAFFKPISPIAWQHVNLYGRYEFSKEPEAINLHTLIQELAHPQIPLCSSGLRRCFHRLAVCKRKTPCLSKFVCYCKAARDQGSSTSQGGHHVAIRRGT